MSAGTYMQPPFSSQPQQGPPQVGPPQRRGGINPVFGLLLVGGGMLILLSVLVAAGVGYAVSQASEPWPDDLWQEGIVELVNDCEIKLTEKTQIMEHFERLTSAADDGKLSRSDLETVLARLEQAPVFVLLDMKGIEREVVNDSGLSAAEQAAGCRSVQRAVRGVCEGKIAIDDFYRALPTGYYVQLELTAYLTQEELDRYATLLEAEPFEPASDEQVRESLAALARLADGASIADEPWTIDASDEFAQALDRALAGFNVR